MSRLLTRARKRVSPVKASYQEDIQFAGLGLRSEEVVSGGRAALLCSLLGALALAGLYPNPIYLAVLVAVPLLVQRAVLSYPAALASRIERASLREAPEVICHLIGGAGRALSCENGVLSCSANSRGMLKGGFERMVWNVYTKGSNIPKDFADYIGTWRDRNQGLEESLQRFLSAARLGRMDNLGSLVFPVHRHNRRKLKSYLSSLKTPVNMVFALGIALPVMIASMLPLSSLASGFSFDLSGQQPGNVGSISPIAVAAVLNIVFPLGMLLYCRDVLSKRPLSNRPGCELKFHDLRGIVAASIVTIALGLVIMTGLFPFTPFSILVVLALATSVMSIALIYTGRRRIPESESREMISAAFESLGDLLQGGDSFEIALLKATERLDGTNLASRMLNDVFLVSRGTIQAGATLTSESALKEYPIFGSSLKVVADIARKDGSIAGSIAKSIAADLRENLQMEADARIELRSVVQTVNSTLTYFSPIVLGVTAAMFLLIEGYLAVSTSLTSSAFVLIVGTLICCNLAVAGYFTQGLQGGSIRAIISRIGKGLLVAIPIFALSFVCALYFFGVF